MEARASAKSRYSMCRLGELLFSLTRLRFTSRPPICWNVVLPTEKSYSNGQLCLNRLGQPRGQAQSGVVSPIPSNLPELCL